MNFDILYLNRREDQQFYKYLASKVSEKEPYSCISFLEIFSDGLDNLICFYLIYNDEVIYMPGYIKHILPKSEFKDFSSPYGYSGPYISKSVTAEFIEYFWQQVDDWYRNNNIISEFIRFSLNENSSNYSGEVFSSMLNVKGRIVDENQQWLSFDKKVRKNVKRAQKEGLLVTIYKGNEMSELLLETFHDIYIKTMERTNSKSKFFYSVDNFRFFITQNPDLCAFVFVMDGELCISTEMLLMSGDSIYSFLGGTLEDYFDKRPNDLLKFETINWARRNNISFYILGGGYGANDGIFKYKRAFFPDDVVSYKVGRKVIDNIQYEIFTSEKMKSLPTENVDNIIENFFPAYRYSI